MASATAPLGSARMCWDDGPLPPEGLPEGVTRRVVRPVAHRHCPLHHGANPLPYSPRGLRLVVPDRGQDRQHVGRGHVGHGHHPDARERIGAQTARPVPLVPRVPPAEALLLQHRGGSLLDRGHVLGLALLGQGIPARPRLLAVGERHVARLGQRHQRVAAEPEHPGPAPNDQPLHPSPRPGRVDAQVQAVAVTVEAGRGGAHEHGAQAMRQAPRRPRRGICHRLNHVMCIHISVYI